MSIHKRLAAVAAAETATLVALAGCSSSGNGNGNAGGGDGSAPAGTASVPAASGNGKTLNLWVMTGDYTPETVDAINAEFTKQTGAQVNVQLQKWDGITTKLTTALSTDTPPDVVDLGNTQVATYAASGGLLDLTDYKTDLAQGQTWLTGLTDPATVDGRLYGAAGFAGTRSVIYNKTMWAKAGITAPPTTWDEFTGDLDKLKAANPSADFSAFYLPGKYWYAGVQFVWDAGGELATSDNGKWAGGMSSDKAQAGLEAFKKFQNTYSAAGSRTVDTDAPDQNQIFADGKAGAMLGTNGKLALIKKANPKLTDDDLGTFAMPSPSGKTMPVMLGGSDWGIAAKSKNTDLALAWVKIAVSPQIQEKWVFGNDAWIPNSTELVKSASAKVAPLQKGFFDAALNSKATPASPNWAELEGNKAINDMFAAVASGAKSPKDAAATFDADATKVLGQ